MSEHFRSFGIETDELAQRVLEPRLNFAHNQLVNHGSLVLRAMGGELVPGGTDSQDWRFTGADNSVMLRINEPDIVIPAILRRGDVGLFYTYTGVNHQLWEPDAKHIPASVDTGNHEEDSLVVLGEILYQATRAPRALGRLASGIGAPLTDPWARWRWTPSPERTKDEIAEHYDLTQEVYTGPLGFLDEGYVQYSSGLLLPGQKFESLDQLQEAKVESLARQLQLDSAETLLEIGSGWGGLAVALALRFPNLRITSLTISDEQLSRARQRAKDAGVDDRVTFLGKDYRHYKAEKPFDRLVSVEMIEAVDWRDMGTYFDSIANFVNPEAGVVVLQSINIKPEDFAHHRHHKNFASTAIFPGGCLVPRDEIGREMGNRGWQLHESTDLSSSYALTLREWLRNLDANKKEISKDWASRGHKQEDIERFYRGFNYYLAMCQAAFRPETNHIQDWQFTFSRKAAAA